MEQLRHDQVTLNSAFAVIGIDYAGPFLIKDRKDRGCKTSKCYVAIFICFASRAMHLELVSDLNHGVVHYVLETFRLLMGHAEGDKVRQWHQFCGCEFGAPGTRAIPEGLRVAVDQRLDRGAIQLEINSRLFPSFQWPLGGWGEVCKISFKESNGKFLVDF